MGGISKSATFSVQSPCHVTQNGAVILQITTVSPTSASEESIGVKIQGTFNVSNASSLHAEWLYAEISVTNSTNSKVVLWSTTVPVNPTDTSTPYNISKTGNTGLLSLNSGSNSITFSSKVKLLDERGNTVENGYLYYNCPNSIIVTRTTNTGAPTNVSISATTVSSNQSVTISWTAASNGTGNPVTSYTVYYSDDSGNTWNNFASVSSSTTSQVVAGPKTSGTTRRYFVRADAIYNSQPMNSAIVSCSYITAGLSAPTNFTVSKDAFSSGDTLTFTWGVSSLIGGISGKITYYIRMSTNGGSTWNESWKTGNPPQNVAVTGTSGTTYMWSVRGKVTYNGTTYYSEWSNTVSATLTEEYTCLSTAVGNVLFTNNSVAVGAPADGYGNVTTLGSFSYTENSSMQMQAQARINTTSLRMRKSPGFNTSGTNWDANVWKVGSATTYLNSPEQYICYGGSGGNTSAGANDNAKLIYVTSTSTQSNINKMLFAQASNGNYIQGGNIPYGENRSVFRLNNGLTMVIKRLPFGVDSTSAGGGMVEVGDWFEDGSSFENKPVVTFSIQGTYDGYAPMPRLLITDDINPTNNGGEIWVGSWQATDTSSVNRFVNCAGLITVMAIGRKA